MKLRKLLGPAILFLLLIASLYASPSSASGAPSACFSQVGNSPSSATQSTTIAKPPGDLVPALPLNPLHDIGWMKGGVWVAEIKDKDANVQTRIETRIRGSENDHLIKFTTTFVEHNRPHLQYEGVYLYDPRARQIEFYYTDSEGNFTRGHAAFANNTLTQDFEIIHLNGQADTLRSVVVRDGDNAYDWNVMSNKSGEWKEIIHLHYVREKAEN